MNKISTSVMVAFLCAATQQAALAATQQEALAKLWQAESAYDSAVTAHNNATGTRNSEYSRWQTYKSLGWLTASENAWLTSKFSDIDFKLWLADQYIQGGYTNKYNGWFQYYVPNYTQAHYLALLSISDSSYAEEYILVEAANLLYSVKISLDSVLADHGPLP